MRAALLSISFFVISHVYVVDAVKLPFRVRTGPRRDLLHKRADVTGHSVNTSNGSVLVINSANAEYIADISLSGVQVPVMLDTGSSDLWVATNVPNATDSGKSASISYAVGTAAGDIFYAPLSFDNYTVQNQAFILVQNTSTFTTDIKALGYEGLVGLGPSSGSVIRKKIGSDKADPMMDRIFQANGTSQNYITFMLSRLNDPGSNITGQMTISEVVAGFENITNQPKLSVMKVHDLTDEDQHWQILTDKNSGIIGPDGQVININTIVPKAPSHQLVAVLDSGYTFPQVPRQVSDAIYGRVQGAEWSTENQIWTIPCTQMLNISFQFGGQRYPIHPLDVSSSDFNLTNSQGQPVCAGTFQPITSAFSLLGEYDMILGMAFLRNTYTLMDYGDFIDESSNDRNDPFVQLLSVTDPVQAHADFVKVRLNGVDSTGDASQQLLPASQGQSSPESAKEKKQHLEERILSHWPEIFVGCLLLFGALFGWGIWKFIKFRRMRRQLKQRPMSSLNADGPYKELSASSSMVGSLHYDQETGKIQDSQSFRGSEYRTSGYQTGNYYPPR